ncbi:MAG: M23 family metallopeptidase, partial [Candidatus Parcubacteria bacterium]|nr:M23 family metallopeptidase [Candidatus Parcubacteria bacterium]
IITQNDLLDETAINIGDELFIPGGRKLATPVAPTPMRSTPPSYVNYGNIPSALPSGTRLQWPTTAYRITQYFGWRHTGIDIADKSRPPVYAAEDGVVIKAQVGGYNGGYGNNIIIDHGNGLNTLYGHLTSLNVHVGDSVSRGQVIGIMGTTGRSTGIHLHFEVRVGGKRVNPLGYVR